jgi:peroxiredoxin
VWVDYGIEFTTFGWQPEFERPISQVTGYTDPIKLNNPAPDFSVPEVMGEGTVALKDYKGLRPVLLGLFRGLHCPFCRRQVVQMDGYSVRLDELGVAALAIINTELPRARAYYGRQSIGMRLGVDPKWDTHRRYGIPESRLTFGKTDWPTKINPLTALTTKMNPDGDLAKPVRLINLNTAVNSADGFELTEVDKKTKSDYGMTGAGFTLIDRTGTVRWRWLESMGGVQDIAKFPSADDVIGAVESALGRPA